MEKLTGRKQLIVRAATTRARNAIKNGDIGIADVDKVLTNLDRELRPLFDDPNAVDEIMDDIAASFEAEDALAAFDAGTIAAVFDNPAMIDKIMAEQAAPNRAQRRAEGTTPAEVGEVPC